MKHNPINVNRIRSSLFFLLIVCSIALTIYSWIGNDSLQKHIGNLKWIAPGLLFTEACFIIGAIFMAISAGEDLLTFGGRRGWVKSLVLVRKHAKEFAQHVITNWLFGVGFWLNFAGAVGTSLILAVSILVFAPYTGFGVLLLIALDLITTFGWRVPLQATRRKVRKNVSH